MEWNAVTRNDRIRIAEYFPTSYPVIAFRFIPGCCFKPLCKPATVVGASNL